MRKTSLEDADGGDEHRLQLLGWMLWLNELLENVCAWADTDTRML